MEHVPLNVAVAVFEVPGVFGTSQGPLVTENVTGPEPFPCAAVSALVGRLMGSKVSDDGLALIVNASPATAS